VAMANPRSLPREPPTTILTTDEHAAKRAGIRGQRPFPVVPSRQLRQFEVDLQKRRSAQR